MLEKIINKKLNKLYVECGTTARSPVNSGIQRVVRCISKELLQIGKEAYFDVNLVVFHEQGIYQLSGDINSINQVERPMLWNLAKKIDQRLRLVFNAQLLETIGNLVKRNIFENENNNEKENICAENGDVLLLLDSTWDVSIWTYVDEFKNQGGRAIAVLYDLIPFTHPETVEEQTRIAHTRWWLEAHMHLDGVICISQAVRQDYLEWQIKGKFNLQLPPTKVEYFHLGSEIGNADPLIKILDANTPFFIMVGSLEPRKNHATVIDAFEMLWANNIKASLVIVGAYGWKSEALIERIQKHSQYGNQLYLIRDASDRDLAALYKNAASLISASLAEGFGLPIVEAQQHGVTVLCSDIPVFKEVAGFENVKFFNPLDALSLMGLLKSICNESLYAVKSKSKRAGLSWRDSARQLCCGILNITKS